MMSGFSFNVAGRVKCTLTGDDSDPTVVTASYETVSLHGGVSVVDAKFLPGASVEYENGELILVLQLGAPIPQDERIVLCSLDAPNSTITDGTPNPRQLQWFRAELIEVEAEDNQLVFCVPLAGGYSQDTKSITINFGLIRV